MIICNDLHLGVNRVAGTTPASAAALSQYSLDAFRDLLWEAEDPDVLIAGDMFDTFNVPNSVLAHVHSTILEFVADGGTLYALKGNHDHSNDSAKLSSFSLLGKLFESARVQFIEEAQMLPGDVYVVPHVANADLFNLELAAIPKCKLCVLHANYDSPFAEGTMHSLNVTEAQAKAIPADLVYFGHEHHARKMLGGKVVIGGVQFPTSVSDVIDGKDKFAYMYRDGVLESWRTWSTENYAELDWRNPGKTDAQFVRFGGRCLPEEAAEMANAIANFRKTSDAFVVSNAVQVGQDLLAEGVNLQSLEQVRKFDVEAALKQMLSPEDVAILERLK